MTGAHRLKCIALVMMVFAGTGSPVAAQTPRAADQNLEAALMPGMTAWITDSSGREEKTRIVGVSEGIVTTASGDDIRRLHTTEVRRVRVRHFDSLLNGALIGAGIAVASGLFLCRAMEPWETCRDDVGPMIRAGAVGAGIGIAIDALIHGRRTIYEAAPGSTRLYAAPMVARDRFGLQVSLRF